MTSELKLQLSNELSFIQFNLPNGKIFRMDSIQQCTHIIKLSYLNGRLASHPNSHRKIIFSSLIRSFLCKWIRKQTKLWNFRCCQPLWDPKVINRYIVVPRYPFSRDYDLASHAAYVCVLISYICNRTYSLKSTLNDSFFEKLFHDNLLFAVRVFARNLLRGNRRGNIFSSLSMAL